MLFIRNGVSTTIQSFDPIVPQVSTNGVGAACSRESRLQGAPAAHFNPGPLVRQAASIPHCYLSAMRLNYPLDFIH
jgi:hypothetical protein